MAPRSTQPFVLLRSIKWELEIPGDLVVKSKQSPRGGSSLEAVKPLAMKHNFKTDRDEKKIFSKSCNVECPVCIRLGVIHWYDLFVSPVNDGKGIDLEVWSMIMLYNLCHVIL